MMGEEEPSLRCQNDGEAGQTATRRNTFCQEHDFQQIRHDCIETRTSMLNKMMNQKLRTKIHLANTQESIRTKNLDSVALFIHCRVQLRTSQTNWEEQMYQSQEEKKLAPLSNSQLSTRVQIKEMLIRDYPLDSMM